MNMDVHVYYTNLQLNYMYISIKFLNLMKTICIYTCFDLIFPFSFLQGSYGIVKLAYNEQDDVHYVSIKQSFCL